MDDTTCTVIGCASIVDIKKYGLCKKHYHVAWKAGRLGERAIWRHSVMALDECGTTGECVACGPGVRIIFRKDRAICWRSTRTHVVKYRHGLNHDELTEWLAVTDGRCSICDVPFSEVVPYCIDHDHSCCPGSTSCGECVRGLLCRSCNVGIGMLGDDIERVTAALLYLDRANRRKVALENLSLTDT